MIENLMNIMYLQYSASWITPKHLINWNKLAGTNRDGVSNHLAYLIRNLCVNNSAYVWVESDLPNRFHIEKEIRKECVVYFFPLTF